MKKCSLLLAIVLSLSLILTGCGARKDAAADMNYFATGGSASNGSASMSAPVPSLAPSYGVMEKVEMDAGYVSDTAYDSVGETIYENQSNKIIRTANLTIQTTDFESSIAALNALTEKYKGYYETAEVSSGSIYDSYSYRHAYYVVRVPKESFIPFRDGTGGIGHVYSMNENNQDVGEVYYDTEARLETLKIKNDRLLALLEKATDMKDIIELENALADVQYQIDQHTSTLRKYDSLIGFSTFRINIEEVQKIEEKPTVTQSFGEKLLSRLNRGFENFVRSLQNFAFWLAENLIGLAIFAVVLAVIFIPTVRRIRKRRAARKLKKATQEAPKADSEE